MNGPIRSSGCARRCAGSASAAAAVSRRSRGTMRSTKWPTASCGVREKYGPFAIAGAVSGAFFSRGLVMAQLTRAIGTPNWLINQDLCGGCRGVTEKMTGLNIAGGEDIDNAACVMIVGRNPLVADPPQWMALKQAKARGARVLVIDPFQTSAAEMADLWLRPRPGTDGAIALAMTKVLIDEEPLRPRRRGELVSRLRCPRRARQHLHARNGPSSRPACRPRRSSRRRGCSRAGRPASSAATASMPRATACRRSAPTIACSQSAATSIASAATGGAKRPKGFKTYFDILFDPAFRLAARDRGAAHRRRAVSAVGGPARLPDGLPQPLRHRGDPDRPARIRCGRSTPAA